MTPDDFPPEDNLALAERRAERLVEHGATVVGISMQAVFAGMSVLWSLIAMTSVRGSVFHVWLAVVAAIGLLLAVGGWILARRRHTLQPFPGTDLEDPWHVLDEAQRRRIAAQLRGREPVTTESAPLVRAMLLWQRRAARSILPALSGAALCLLATGATSSLPLGGGWPWLLTLELLAVSFVTAKVIVERRRRNRILADLARSGESERAAR